MLRRLFIVMALSSAALASAGQAAELTPLETRWLQAAAYGMWLHVDTLSDYSALP